LKTTHNIFSNLKQLLFKILLHNLPKNGTKKYMVFNKTLY
jgi:hypothetical protein